LWIKKRWDELDDAMDFVSKFDYEKLKAQL
jgi:hypothetical protein